MAKRQMTLPDFMLGSAKNRKVADKFESQRADENPESIESSDTDKLASTGADTKPLASLTSGTSKKRE